MHRRLFRRRSIILLAAICCLIYISSKLLLINKPTELDGIYDILPLNLRHINLESMTPRLDVSNIARRNRVSVVNCAAIIQGNKNEIKFAQDLMKSGNYTRKGITDREYIRMTSRCEEFRNTRGYGFYNISDEERNFSVAYSILMYKDVEQAERLLRALYSPLNIFCFHVDADAKAEVHEAVEGIAKCFDNVFVATRKEYVVYAGFTRLQADLNCMDNLLQRGMHWKYFINLPSQEFPLKTNKEIAKILKLYNGANDIEGLTGARRLVGRYSNRFIYKRNKNEIKPKLMKTSIKKGDPPHNITVVKGSAYGIFSRAFVEFVIKDKMAREVLDWYRDVFSPDEYFWATLQYNQRILGTPGSYYTGKPDDKPWYAVYAAWGSPCHGKFVHGVCVFGIGDLHFITSLNHLFANKFYINFQPLALDCLEEWHYNKTVNAKLSTLNTTHYAQLPFIGKAKS